MLHTLDKLSLQKRVSLPLEMQVGEMAQIYHPYKSPQGRLPLEMQIEVALPVSHCGRPSLLECLSKTTLLQMSEAGIGEIWTLPLVFDTGLVNPAGTWIRVPRVWIPMTIFVNYAISVPVSIKPAPAIAGLA